MTANSIPPLVAIDHPAKTPMELEAEHRARELLVFADGVADAGGCPDLRRRARLGAQDTLDLLAALEAERSARAALQARCEQQQEILARRAYEAMT